MSKLTKTNKLTTTNACNNMTAVARFEQKKIVNKSQCILSLLRSFFVVFVPCHMHIGMYGLKLNVGRIFNVLSEEFTGPK